MSLVPADASDIRDTSSAETFTDIDARAFRANLFTVVGGVMFVLAALWHCWRWSGFRSASRTPATPPNGRLPTERPARCRARARGGAQRTRRRRLDAGRWRAAHWRTANRRRPTRIGRASATCRRTGRSPEGNAAPPRPGRLIPEGRLVEREAHRGLGRGDGADRRRTSSPAMPRRQVEPHRDPRIARAALNTFTTRNSDAKGRWTRPRWTRRSRRRSGPETDEVRADLDHEAARRPPRGHRSGQSRVVPITQVPSVIRDSIFEWRNTRAADLLFTHRDVAIIARSS